MLLDGLNASQSGGLKEWAEISKNAIEALAVVVGGYYAIRRLRAGYNIVNLSLEVICDRFRDENDKTKDVLAIKLALKKGDRGSVQIHDIQVRINGEIQKSDTLITLREQFRRYDCDWDSDPHRLKSEWNKDFHLLTLSPGEATNVTGFCMVDHSLVGQVSATVLGVEKNSGKVSQWRASTVSGPAKS